jgi:hypothetical protein
MDIEKWGTYMTMTMAMTIFKDKRVKSIIVFCITLISLLELYFAYRILAEYRGIYEGWGFFIPFIYQPFWGIRLFKKELAYYKFRMLGIGLIAFACPFIIYFTLPNYTYNEGKYFVEQYVQSSGNYEFIEFSREKDTIPVVDNPQRLFVSNRAYYYGIKSIVNNTYFMVNPLTGKVVQLAENYWEYKK